jgi:hypothetical protein
MGLHRFPCSSPLPLHLRRRCAALLVIHVWFSLCKMCAKFFISTTPDWRSQWNLDNLLTS